MSKKKISRIEEAVQQMVERLSRIEEAVRLPTTKEVSMNSDNRLAWTLCAIGFSFAFTLLGVIIAALLC